MFYEEDGDFCDDCGCNPCRCSPDERSPSNEVILGGWEPCPCDCGHYVNGEEMPNIFPIIPCTYRQSFVVDVLHPADHGKVYIQ